MRVRALSITALALAAALGGAWALGVFGGSGSGPAPAGDDGADADAVGARLATTVAKAKAADPGEAPRPKPRGGIVGTVWGATEPAAARVEAYLVSSSPAQEWVEFEAVARVRAYGADPPKPTAVASAGADGRFAIEGLAAGTYVVGGVGAAGGFAQAQVRLAAEGARATVLLRLSVGGETLRGRVRRADGSPWRGMVSTPPPTGPGPLPTTRATTDEQGRFTLSGLPVGPSYIVAAEPGTRTWSSGSVRVPRPDEWVWTLPPDVECTGLVVGASDEKPIGGAVVACSGPVSAQTNATTVVATTDDAGRFRFARAAGRSSLQVTAPGRRKATLTITDPSETPTVHLVRVSRLSGRVLSDEGAPIAGVTVLARAVSGWDWQPPTTVSAADGTYELASIAGGEQQVVAVGGGWVSKGLLDTKDGGYSPLVVDVPIEGSATYDVVVSRGGRAQGRVLDSAGAPLPGATITTSFPSVSRTAGWTLTGLLTTASDADGAFVLQGVPAGTMFDVTGTATGYVSAKVGPFRADPAVPAQADLKLVGGTFLDVSVADKASKAPLAGALVNTWSWSQNGGSGGAPQVVTGADGHARCGPLAGTNGSVSVSAPDHRSASKQLTSAADGVLVFELETQGSSAVAGHVTFSDGGPPGGDVWVTMIAGDRQDQTGVAEDGAFRFTSAPSGTVKLSAQLGWGDDAPKATAEATAGDEDVRIAFAVPRPATLRARVMDVDGAPIPAFDFATSGTTGTSDGRDGRLDLYGVQKEAWVFVYRARGPSGAPLPLAATAAGPFHAGRTPVDVRLGPERVIEGLVRGPDGTGLRGAVLSARPVSLPGALSDALGQTAIAQARTDERGAYRLGGLGTGEYALVVSTPPDFPAPPPISVPAGQTHVDIDLTRGAVVEVTVLASDGRPVLGANVSARLPGQRQRLAPSASTDASGVARLSGLDPAGRYELRVDPTRGSGVGMWKKIASWSPRNETVRLEPAFKIQGAFRRPDGKPIAGAGVTGRPVGGNPDEVVLGAQTAADGTFTLDLVPQGTFRLLATSTAPRFEGECTAESGAQDAVMVGVECPGKLVVTFEGRPADDDGSHWVQLTRDGAGPDDPGGLGAQVTGATATIEGLRADASYTLYAAFSGGFVAYAKGLKAGAVKVAVKVGKTITGHIKAPATRSNLSVWMSGVWAQATVEPDGSFVVKGVPEGTWTLTASGLVGEGWWSAEAKGVEAGSSVDLELKPK